MYIIGIVDNDDLHTPIPTIELHLISAFRNVVIVVYVTFLITLKRSLDNNMDIEGSDSVLNPSTKLFIKQIYSKVTLPNIINDNDNYLLLNNKRLDSIFVQGIITKIFKYNDHSNGKTSIRALLDDGSGVIIITNMDRFLDQINKGSYIIATGDLSLSEDKQIAMLHPDTIKIILDPNLETLWNLEVINYLTQTR